MAFIPIIAAVIGAAASASAQQSANNSNQQSVVANQQFQQTNSNSAYQRSVADMEKAGLNPLLAYNNGGASTPAGGTAQFGNTMAGAPGAADSIASAINAHKFDADQRDQINAQTTQAEAGANQAQNQAEQVLVQTQNERKRTAGIDSQNEALAAQAQIATTNAKIAADNADTTLQENAARRSAAQLNNTNNQINYQWVNSDNALQRTGNYIDTIGNAAKIIKPGLQINTGTPRPQIPSGHAQMSDGSIFNMETGETR